MKECQKKGTAAMREEGGSAPGGVLVIGSLSILFGVVGLLAAVFQVGTLLLAAREHDLTGATMLYAAVPECVFGIAWIAAGCGLFKLKGWARTTATVLSVITAAFSVLLFIIVAAVIAYLGVLREGAPPVVMLVVGAVIGIILVGIFGAVPLVFLVYLSKERVKRRFSIAPGAVQRPLGVNILIAWYFLSVLSFFSLAQARGGPFCGFILRGAWFQLYWLLCVGVSVYIAVGFLKLRRRAWLAAVWYNLFNIANVLLTAFLVPPEQLLELSQAHIQNPEVYIKFFSIPFYVVAAVTGGITLYLLRKRATFVT